MNVVVPPRIISMHPSLVPRARSSSVLSESILNTLSRKSGNVRSSTTPFITDIATWVWVLIIPGITMSPVASISLSAVPSYAGPTETILSPSITTSPLRMRLDSSCVTIHALRIAVIIKMRLMTSVIKRASGRPNAPRSRCEITKYSAHIPCPHELPHNIPRDRWWSSHHHVPGTFHGRHAHRT